MAQLWGAAYPQLRALLEKAGAWAAQVPTPARRKRSPQFFGLPYQAAPVANPQVISEAEGLLLKTVQRTSELIDTLPDTAETGAQMAQLWGAAYPQLRALLEKAGAWAAQVPTPARRKRSPQFFGLPTFNQAPVAPTAAVNPAVITEAEGLLLSTVRRTSELIDPLPNTAETGAQMAQLWGAAYPQLRALLEKAGAWAAQ